MSRYRKVPVEIDAHHFTPDTPPHVGAAPEWLAEAMLAQRVSPCYAPDGSGRVDALDIKTDEGTMRCSPGDWIIRGVEGELYPCRDSVFRATYEPVAA